VREGARHRLLCLSMRPGSGWIYLAALTEAGRTSVWISARHGQREHASGAVTTARRSIVTPVSEHCKYALEFSLKA
jgi:hypothetical protein